MGIDHDVTAGPKIRKEQIKVLVKLEWSWGMPNGFMILTKFKCTEQLLSQSLGEFALHFEDRRAIMHT